MTLRTGRNAVAVAILVMPSAVMAAHDMQTWLTLSGDVRLNERNAATFDAVVRSRPNSADVAQTILRAGFRRQIGGGANVHITYGWYDSINAGRRNTTESRFGENFAFPILATRTMRADGRLGMEQRLPSSGGALGWRLRPRVRIIMPLDERWNVQISDELIYSLNDTHWGQQSGYTANRAGIAFRRALNAHLGASLGYSWQSVHVSSAPDRQDHVASLAVDFHL